MCSKGSQGPKLSLLGARHFFFFFFFFVVVVVFFFFFFFFFFVELIFTALRHFSGHFEPGQFTYPHCSMTLAILLGSLSVLSAHSFVSN